VVSGCEVTSQLQRLLTSLSNFIGRFIKKPEPEAPAPKQNLGGNPEGVFVNQTKAPLEYYSEELYDEEDDFYIRVSFVCACGEPVFRLMAEDYGFGCEHCDSVCRKHDCKNCYNLNSVDYGDPNANL